MGSFVAGRLAEARLDVVGIESAPPGGGCPYWGSVPSKMIIQAANTLAEARRAGKLAGHASAGPADGEVRGALTVAVHAQVAVAMLNQMIYAYPTLYRAIEDAIAQLSLRRAGSNHGPRHSSQGRAASAGPFPSPARPSTARWNALSWQRAAPARTVIP